MTKELRQGLFRWHYREEDFKKDADTRLSPDEVISLQCAPRAQAAQPCSVCVRGRGLFIFNGRGRRALPGRVPHPPFSPNAIKIGSLLLR